MVFTSHDWISAGWASLPLQDFMPNSLHNHYPGQGLLISPAVSHTARRTLCSSGTFTAWMTPSGQKANTGSRHFNKQNKKKSCWTRPRSGAGFNEVMNIFFYYYCCTMRPRRDFLALNAPFKNILKKIDIGYYNILITIIMYLNHLCKSHLHWKKSILVLALHPVLILHFPSTGHIKIIVQLFGLLRTAAAHLSTQSLSICPLILPLPVCFTVYLEVLLLDKLFVAFQPPITVRAL